MITNLLIGSGLVAATVIIHATGLGMVLSHVLHSSARPDTRFWPIAWLLIRIAWFLIVTTALSLITTLTMLDNPQVKELIERTPVSVPLQYALMFLGLTVKAVSGCWFLQGKNWARWLYVIWTSCSMAYGLFTSPMILALIPGLLVFGVICVFLFLPSANAFFFRSHTFPREAGR